MNPQRQRLWKKRKQQSGNLDKVRLGTEITRYLWRQRPGRGWKRAARRPSHRPRPQQIFLERLKCRRATCRDNSHSKRQGRVPFWNQGTRERLHIEWWDFMVPFPGYVPKMPAARLILPSSGRRLENSFLGKLTSSREKTKQHWYLGTPN